jgi:protein disulfide-isomerase A1
VECGIVSRALDKREGRAPRSRESVALGEVYIRGRGRRAPCHGTERQSAAMQPPLALLGATLLALLPWQAASVAAQVLALSEANEADVTGAEFALVEFYAPWCGHCKKLAPEYAKAAAALKDSVTVAKCDATQETALAAKYGVLGFPTLKFFRAGEALEYTGGRTEAEIVDWVAKKTEPPLRALADQPAVDAFVADATVAAVFFGEAGDGAEYQAVLSAAVAAEAAAYGHVADAAVAVPSGGTPPALVVYKSFDPENPAQFDGKFEAKAVQDFVQIEALQPMIDFKEENMHQIFSHSGRKLHQVLLFTDPSAEYHEGTVAAMSEAYSSYKGSCVNVMVDAAEESSSKVLDFFGIQRDQLPAVRGFDQAANKKYESAEPVLGNAGHTTAEFFSQFGRSLAAGDLPPVLKSEAEPKGGGTSSSVRIVVGKTFRRDVLDAADSVFLEIYAPWCGHCKQLAPLIEELAEQYDDSSGVVVAKMDGTTNEAAGLDVKGFPSLRLYSAGGEGGEKGAADEGGEKEKRDANGVVYEGDRTLAAMTAWIEAHTGVRTPEAAAHPPPDTTKQDL